MGAGKLPNVREAKILSISSAPDCRLADGPVNGLTNWPRPGHYSCLALSARKMAAASNSIPIAIGAGGGVPWLACPARCRSVGGM